MAENNFWSDPGKSVSQWASSTYNDANNWFKQNVAPSFSGGMKGETGYTIPSNDFSNVKWSYSPETTSFNAVTDWSKYDSGSGSFKMDPAINYFSNDKMDWKSQLKMDPAIDYFSKDKMDWKSQLKMDSAIDYFQKSPDFTIKTADFQRDRDGGGFMPWEDGYKTNFQTLEGKLDFGNLKYEAKPEREAMPAKVSMIPIADIKYFDKDKTVLSSSDATVSAPDMWFKSTGDGNFTTPWNVKGTKGNGGFATPWNVEGKTQEELTADQMRILEHGGGTQYNTAQASSAAYDSTAKLKQLALQYPDSVPPEFAGKGTGMTEWKAMREMAFIDPSTGLTPKGNMIMAQIRQSESPPADFKGTNADWSKLKNMVASIVAPEKSWTEGANNRIIAASRSQFENIPVINVVAGGLAGMNQMWVETAKMGAGMSANAGRGIISGVTGQTKAMEDSATQTNALIAKMKTDLSQTTDPARIAFINSQLAGLREVSNGQRNRQRQLNFNSNLNQSMNDYEKTDYWGKEAIEQFALNPGTLLGMEMPGMSGALKAVEKIGLTGVSNALKTGTAGKIVSTVMDVATPFNSEGLKPSLVSEAIGLGGKGLGWLANTGPAKWLTKEGGTVIQGGKAALTDIASRAKGSFDNLLADIRRFDPTGETGAINNRDIFPKKTPETPPVKPTDPETPPVKPTDPETLTTPNEAAPSTGTGAPNPDSTPSTFGTGAPNDPILVTPVTPHVELPSSSSEFPPSAEIPFSPAPLPEPSFAPTELGVGKATLKTMQESGNTLASNLANKAQKELLANGQILPDTKQQLTDFLLPSSSAKIAQKPVNILEEAKATITVPEVKLVNVENPATLIQSSTLTPEIKPSLVEVKPTINIAERNTINRLKTEAIQSKDPEFLNLIDKATKEINATGTLSLATKKAINDYKLGKAIVSERQVINRLSEEAAQTGDQRLKNLVAQAKNDTRTRPDGRVSPATKQAINEYKTAKVMTERQKINDLSSEAAQTGDKKLRELVDQAVADVKKDGKVSSATKDDINKYRTGQVAIDAEKAKPVNWLTKVRDMGSAALSDIKSRAKGVINFVKNPTGIDSEVWGEAMLGNGARPGDVPLGHSLPTNIVDFTDPRLLPGNVVVNAAKNTPGRPAVALSDTHADVDAHFNLLKDSGQVTGTVDKPIRTGNAEINNLGDLMDRGDSGYKNVKLAMNIESQNPALYNSLMGNHDALAGGLAMSLRDDAKLVDAAQQLYKVGLEKGTQKGFVEVSTFLNAKGITGTKNDLLTAFYVNHGKLDDALLLSKDSETLKWILNRPALKVTADGDLLAHADGVGAYLPYGKSVSEVNANVARAMQTPEGALKVFNDFTGSASRNRNKAGIDTMLQTYGSGVGGDNLADRLVTGHTATAGDIELRYGGKQVAVDATGGWSPNKKVVQLSVDNTRATIGGTAKAGAGQTPPASSVTPPTTKKIPSSPKPQKAKATPNDQYAANEAEALRLRNENQAANTANQAQLTANQASSSVDGSSSVINRWGGDYPEMSTSGNVGDLARGAYDNIYNVGNKIQKVTWSDRTPAQRGLYGAAVLGLTTVGVGTAITLANNKNNKPVTTGTGPSMTGYSWSDQVYRDTDSSSLYGVDASGIVRNKPDSPLSTGKSAYDGKRYMMYNGALVPPWDPMYKDLELALGKPIVAETQQVSGTQTTTIDVYTGDPLASVAEIKARMEINEKAYNDPNVSAEDKDNLLKELQHDGYLIAKNEREADYDKNFNAQRIKAGLSAYTEQQLKDMRATREANINKSTFPNFAPVGDIDLVVGWGSTSNMSPAKKMIYETSKKYGLNPITASKDLRAQGVNLNLTQEDLSTKNSNTINKNAKVPGNFSPTTGTISVNEKNSAATDIAAHEMNHVYWYSLSPEYQKIWTDFYNDNKKTLEKNVAHYEEQDRAKESYALGRMLWNKGIIPDQFERLYPQYFQTNKGVITDPVSFVSSNKVATRHTRKKSNSDQKNFNDFKLSKRIVF